MRKARPAEHPVPVLGDADSKVSLCERVREGLRLQIVQGQLKPGDAVMPVRQLCKALKINRVTADQAIRDLVMEGLLRSEHGRGVFVNDLSPYRVALLPRMRSEHAEAPGGYAAMLAAAQDALTRANVVAQIVFRKEGERFGPSLDEALALNADGYLPIGIQNEEYLARLAETGKPVVAVDAAPLRCSFDGVVHDSFRTGYLAARHLLERGHRRILFIGYDRGPHPGDPTGRARIPEPDSERMAAGFVHALKEAAVPREEAKFFDFLPREGDAKFALARDLRGGAYTGAVMAQSHAEGLKARGELPAELSVVITEAEAGSASARAWTRVELDEKEFGRQGAARMLQRLPNARKGLPGPAGGSLITIEPVLVDGPSTRRVGPPPELYEFLKAHPEGAQKEVLR
ncbi:MAG: GntR family transcriptional regulator [Planctomycetota bacterium]|nr:GntR family transcriptional regulator [Planctomycetota bacterium]